MLICELTEIGKMKRLMCSVTGAPCGFQKYCEIKMKYIQTSGAERCKVREEHGKRNDKADS